MNQEHKTEEKLAACACGRIPEELYIVDGNQGGKWAWVYGGCCGEWHIEFRTEYHDINSDACKKLAIEAWNLAPRAAIDRDKKEIARLREEVERLRGAMLTAASILERDGDEHSVGYALRRAMVKP